jgi:hypothetical protein
MLEQNPRAFDAAPGVDDEDEDGLTEEMRRDLEEWPIGGPSRRADGVGGGD